MQAEHRPWTRGRSWVELRAAFAGQCDAPPIGDGSELATADGRSLWPCGCVIISYDTARDLYKGPPAEALGWTPCPNHAGYAKRCPTHDVAPKPRTWILDIPVCRFKNFLRYEAGVAFAVTWLKALLPKNHPEYHAS